MRAKLEILNPVVRAEIEATVEAGKVSEVVAEAELVTIDELMRGNGAPLFRSIRGFGTGLPSRPLSPRRLES